MLEVGVIDVGTGMLILLAGGAVALSVLAVMRFHHAGRSTAAYPTADELRHHRIATAVMKLACSYEPTECEALRRFLPVQRKSDCLFAKAAQVWGSRDWDSSLSLEQNVERSVPMLLQFLLRSETEELDGFVLELRGKDYGTSPCALGQAVRRALVAIDESDPAGVHCMRKGYIGARGWHFEFAKVPIFVTTFAPCYGLNSSRHSFGAHPESSFLLLQPEASFLRHDLPPDDPSTQWDAPRTIRDRIRKSFRDHGRAYHVPETTTYPPSEHVVKPLGGVAVEDHRLNVVRWWEHKARQFPAAISPKT